MDNAKVICIDFDGVLHKYSKRYHDGSLYDGAMDDAQNILEELIKSGYEIVIYTCRRDEKELRKWIKTHLGWVVHNNIKEINTTKPKGMMYIDDRAFRFTNWKDIRNMLL